VNADAGDWEVTDPDGRHWSVRDDIFHSTYEHVNGKRWRRVGSSKSDLLAKARPSSFGKVQKSRPALVEPGVTGAATGP
jgi:hypothetical protein